MSDEIKDAILALQKGDSTSFKDVVNNELMNRAMDSIQLQKMNAGQAFFDDPELEDVVDDEPEVEEEPEEEPEVENEPEEPEQETEEPADEEI